MAEYQFKVYSRTGTFIADLSRIATNRKFAVGRNESGQITFDLDSDELLRYAQSLSTTPEQILSVGANEVRVSRIGRDGNPDDLIGGRIDVYEDNADTERTKTVTCRGFLDMFNDRLIEKERFFPDTTEAGEIAWALIDESQTGSSDIYETPLPDPDVCDFGVTQGTIGTTDAKERTYEVGKPIKEAIVQLTQVEDPIDFWFTADKVFHVSTRQGSDKPLIKFSYPFNVSTIKIPTDATSLANRIQTLGADDGAGSRLQAIDEDSDSQINYRLRQRREQYNVVVIEDTLHDHGRGALALRKNPIRVPQLTVSLNEKITIEDFWVGDRITIENTHPALPELAGLYRVEKIDMSISDEGTEEATIEVSL